MYMASNQPLNRADTVFDGAVFGAAMGGAAMYGLSAAAPKIQQFNNKEMRENKQAYKEASAADRAARQTASAKAGQEALTKFDKENPTASPSERMKAQYSAQEAAGTSSSPSEKRTKAAKDLRFNRTVDKYSKKLQGGSGRTKAMMYGGSIIAGALGGAWIDSGN